MGRSPLAEWRPIAGKHYAGRQGRSITHITLHIMCGTLAGSDSWFRTPGVAGCTHYGVGAHGEIWQWIDEANGSWGDGGRASNLSSISIEHQGGLENVACTPECVEASARLCADIARRMGWPRLVVDGTRGNVWLHRFVPSTTHKKCPDLEVNGLPFQEVVDRANEILTGKTKEDELPTVDDVWGKKVGGGKDVLTVITDIAAIVQDNRDNMAGKVWAAPANGVRAADRLTGIDGAANATANAVPQLQATIAALGAAVDSLSKAQGADPDKIAATVQAAVAAKLAEIDITVSTNGKKA